MPLADTGKKDKRDRASTGSSTLSRTESTAALTLAQNAAHENRVLRDQARKARNRTRKEQLKRVYANRWERRVMRFVGLVTDTIKHRKRPFVYMDTASDTLYVGDQKFFGKAFLYFTVHHYLRRGAIMLVCDRWWDRLVALLLMVHSVSVLYQEPKSSSTSLDSATPWLVDVIEVIDRLLLVFFALELCIASLAMGMRRMLTSPFKVLDLLVVAIGLSIDMVPSNSPGLVYLQSLNALRPLRVVQRVSGMRKLMFVVMSCMPTMGSVVILVLVLLFMFSMAGVILFGSSLHVRCMGAGVNDFTNVCSDDVTGIDWLSTPCQFGYNCTSALPTPNNWANFDNVGVAIFSVLQVMTLDDWMVIGADVMNGFTPFAWFYFFILTVVGSFWAVNLMLAVITDAFSRFFAEEQADIESIETAAKDGGAVNSRAAISKALQGNSNVSAGAATHVAYDAKKALQARFKPTEDDVESESSYYSSDENSLVRERVSAADPHLQTEFRRWVRSLARQSQASIIHGLKPETLSLIRQAELKEERNAWMEVSSAGTDRHATAADEADDEYATPREKFTSKKGSREEHSAVFSDFTWSHSALFDDQDIVATAEVYNRTRAPPLPATPGMRKLQAMKEVQRRLHLIRTWLDEVEELDDDEDEGPLDNQREMDIMYEPMLVVPEASYPVGTPGKIFDGPEASKRGLSLFDRYAAAAKEQPSISESDDSDDEPEQVKLERLALGRQRYVGYRERTRRFLHRVAKNFFQVGHMMSDELLKSATEVQHLPLSLIIESIHRSPRFTRFITFMVLLNCFVLMFVFFGMPEGLSITIDVVSAFVDFVIVADFAAMFYFDGSKTFFKRLRKSSLGFIDGLVAVLCFIDFVLAETRVVPVLRVIRIVRFMKVFRHFKLLHWIVRLIRSSLYYLVNVLLLLLMFAIAFAVSGRHAFDGWVPPPTECNAFVMPTTCNAESWCVWVNATEWIDHSDFSNLRSREVIPEQYLNMSYGEMVNLAANLTAVDDDALRDFLQTYRNYQCRQYGGWKSVTGPDRLTFNDFGTSFLTIFNFVTKDNWTTVMFNYMSYDAPGAAFSCIYFLVVFLMGGYVLTCLLVAILLVNFGKEEDLQQESPEEAEKKLDEEQARRENPGGPRRTSSEGPGTSVPLEPPLAHEAAVEAELKEHSGVALMERFGADAVEDDEDDEDDTNEFDVAATTRKVKRFGLRALGWLCDENDPIVDPKYFVGRSFFFFSTTNHVRLFCGRLVAGTYFPFQRVVFLCALVHGIVGTIDDRLFNAEVYSVAYAFDWAFTLLSLVDIIIRGIVQGAALTKYSFVSHNVSNKADAIAVACSFLSMVLDAIFPEMRSSAVFNAGLALKALRPVRLMVRSKATKNVFLAVWRTVPAMLNVLGLSAIMFIATAIMCVEVFGGVMQRCSDGSDRAESECVGQYLLSAESNVVIQGNATSALVDRQWGNQDMYHFDNTFTSFNTLFMLSVMSQWTNVMYNVIDAPNEPGGPPNRGNRPWVGLFFVIWVFFSNFCLQNIFVGTVVDNFTKLKLQMAGSLFLTEEQSEVAHIRKLLHQTGVKKALNLSEKPFIRRELNVICYKIANNWLFQNAVKLVVFYNIIIIATVHYDQEPQWFTIQLYSTIAVALVFTAEMIIKVCIAGPRAYLAIGFNRIDFFIVVQSMIEVVLYIAVPPYREQAQLQIFRLIRVLRIVRERKGFRRLVHTGYRSLPAMWNIGSLLILVFYVFAFLGMAFFNNVRTVIYDDSGAILDYDLNFFNFPRSMITLYLIATLDNWGDVMQGTAVQPPYCVEGLDCGYRVVAYLFFLFFIVAVAFVMVNLFIAVVLENFSESVLLPTYMKERMQDVNVFRSAWVTFDPAGRQIISAAHFVPLLRQLPGPRRRLEQLQGRDGSDVTSQCSWTQEEMEYYAAHCAIGLAGEEHASTIPTLKQLRIAITMPRQEVLFADAIDAIGEKIFHVQLVNETQGQAKAKKNAAEYLQRWRVVDYYCAVLIQQAYRDYIKRKYDPDSATKRFKKWDAVLGPVLQHIWSHHAVGVFGEETAEDAAKIRKLTRGRRRDRHAEEVGESRDEDSAAGSKHIKEKLSLKAALEERMVDVDDEVVEDDSWKYAIQDVSSDGSSDPDEIDEEFWLSDDARRRKRAMQAQGMAYSVSRDSAGQLVSLHDLIQRYRRQHQSRQRWSAASARKVAKLPPRARPKWEPLPMPSGEEMTHIVRQPKPMTKNQLMLYQQQVSANPAMRDQCPVTLEPLAYRRVNQRPNESPPSPDNSVFIAPPRHVHDSARTVEANDGEIPNLERIIAEMRRKRAEAAAPPSQDEGRPLMTRPRANFVVFEPERSFRKEKPQSSANASPPSPTYPAPLGPAAYESL
jgi:hypothetical protein